MKETKQTPKNEASDGFDDIRAFLASVGKPKPATPEQPAASKKPPVLPKKQPVQQQNDIEDFLASIGETPPVPQQPAASKKPVLPKKQPVQQQNDIEDFLASIGETPPVPQQPAASKKPVPQQPTAGGPSQAKQNLATSRSTGGGQSQTSNDIIQPGNEVEDFSGDKEYDVAYKDYLNSLHHDPEDVDPMDPSSANAEKKRLQHGQTMFDRRNDANKNVFRGKNVIKKDNTSPYEKRLDMWNKMTTSGMDVGQQKLSKKELKKLSGVDKINAETQKSSRKSTWAYALANALKLQGVKLIDVNPESPTFGKPLPEDENGNITDAFMIRHTAVTKQARHEDNKNNYPEIFVTRQQLKDAEEHVWDTLGNPHNPDKDSPDYNAGYASKTTSLTDKMLKGYEKVQDIPPHVKRAVNFVGIIYNPRYKLTDKRQTVEGYAARLGEIANYLANRRNKPNDIVDDPTMDQQAVSYIITKARENNDATIHTRTPGSKINAKTVVTFMSPSGDRDDPTALTDPILQGPAADPETLQAAKGEEMDVLNPEDIFKAHANRANKIFKNKPTKESQEWSDIYNLMEQWGL